MNEMSFIPNDLKIIKKFNLGFKVGLSKEELDDLLS